MPKYEFMIKSIMPNNESFVFNNEFTTEARAPWECAPQGQISSVPAMRKISGKISDAVVNATSTSGATGPPCQPLGAPARS